MENKTERVVTCTNLWIGFLFIKDFKKLDGKIKSGMVKLLFSLELIKEFLTVANLPKFKKYFGKGDLELLLDVHGELVDIRSQVKVSYVSSINRKSQFPSRPPMRDLTWLLL